MSEVDRIARAYREMEARGGKQWSLGNAGNRRILEGRRAAFRSLLDDAGLIPLGLTDVLEVGCGAGSELAWLLELGASPGRLVGVDLLPDRIATARDLHPEIDFHQANAEDLPFPAARFDLVLAITVFSSILEPGMATRVASEIARVVRPHGRLLWYDVRYDSLSNPSVKAVTRARIRELFPAFDGDLRTITLAPPLARKLGRATALAYPVLSLAPPLRTHLCGLLQRRPD